MKKLSFNNKLSLCYSFDFKQRTTSEKSWRIFNNLQCCKTCKKTLQCCLWFCLLPDSAAGAIRVHSSHSTNPGANRWIFIHIHDVVIHREDWWLVNVTDDDSHWCGIFKWSQVRETSIHINVGGFNVECVNFPLLIVQGLQRCRKSTWTNSKETITIDTFLNNRQQKFARPKLASWLNECGNQPPCVAERGQREKLAVLY